MARQRLHILLISAALSFFFLSCKAERRQSSPKPHTAPQQQAAALPPPPSAQIRVEPAPFDRFPADDKFPLVFRFSQPVAPPERAESANFSSLSISPNKYGAWRWVSDSELRFEAQDAWRPRETLLVSLKGLRTSDGTQGPAPSFTPESFAMALPEATASLGSCELKLRNRAPLVQYPAVSVRFNYRADIKNHALTYGMFLLSGGEKEEKLATTATPWKEGMSIDFTGPDLFRPDLARKVRFSLQAGVPFAAGGVLEKGIECSLAIDPLSWDELAEKTKAPPAELPLAVFDLEAPKRLAADPREGRAPLLVRFRHASTSLPAPHGKAKGITLDQGLTLAPSIAGVWKTDETTDNAIAFVPAAEWPVGQRIKLIADQNAFPAVQFKEREADFDTPRMEAQFSEMSLYTDPENAALRRVVGALRFSHPPRKGDIERLLSLRMRIEPTKSFFAPEVRSLQFSLQPDEKEPWVVYLKSEKIDLPQQPGEVLFTLAAGLSAAQGGSPTENAVQSNLKIPSLLEIFQIASAFASVVTKNEAETQRILTLEASEPVAVDALQSALELFLLPDCRQKSNAKLCRSLEQFSSEAVITDEVLAQSEQLSLSPVPRDEASLPKLFLFSFQAPGKRQLFLRVKKTLRSQTNFPLARDFRTVLYAEAFRKSLKIMHEGALLSISGSKKLGVSVRGIPRVEYELARVMPHDVHHLISVTSGNFAKPSFDSWHISLDQLAERFHYLETFYEQDPGRTYYSAVDFSRFLSPQAAPHGLFVLTAREKRDEKTGEEEADAEEASCGEGEDCGGAESEAELSAEDGLEGEGGGGEYSSSREARFDRRLVLLTDLGLLVKDSLSGEHDVFVMSFRTGGPVSGAFVKLLGQNGVPLFTAKTGPDGRVQFPATQDFKNEKSPLVYVVEHGDDYSFLPFGRSDRQLNLSRFETGGIFNAEEAEGLRALIFSDRGIYRPGEEARFGIMVRRRNLDAAGSRLPLEIALSDPRGIEILRRKFVLSKEGFDDFRWSTENALTGTYALGIYLVRGEQQEKKALLGSTSFRVDEFQPDKLAVSSRYLDKEGGPAAGGWSSIHGAFQVSVKNLFGTPAVNNRVKGTLLVRPWIGVFDAFPGYSFYTRDAAANLPTQPEDLGEQSTDEQGSVSFLPEVSRFSETAFRLEFAAEAFEKDSGRSVVSTAGVLLSSSPYFLGWKADGSLDFVAKGAARKLSLLAVGPDVKPRELQGLVLKLEETSMISALVKQPNGLLQYQLTPKVSQVWNGSLDINPDGTEFMLQTDSAGDFRLRFFDAQGAELGVVHYLVHGEGNKSFIADRAAEVGIRLNKTSLEPGEELEVSINTPYAGAGLLTIERERIYASQWFRSDTLSSVQRIKVPAGIIGNAYVSVAFVRSLDSKDIFASPLCYAAKPFSIARSEYTTKVELSVPPRTKPGRDLEVLYRLSSPGRVLLYAVDEGILQFARYKNPDPVQSFVPKRALEVETYQILDLLLPDYKLVEELSSPGGDEDVGLGKFKNPFARKRRPPMAFWSGVLPPAAEGSVQIPIPDYFNGTVRLIAVEAGEKKLGTAAAQTVAQHDFVIEPQAPYFVSPGDEFEVGATVANTVLGSGKDAKVRLTLTPSAGLQALAGSFLDMVIPEGEDRSFRMRLRAGESLGEQEFRIEAAGLGLRDSAVETVSLRPPQPYRTTMQIGVYRPDKDLEKAEKTVAQFRSLYPEKREVSAAISSSPLSVGPGLVTFLKNYPYGCTEQLVSSAFPAVLFAADAELGLDSRDVERYTKRAFQALSSRQHADGSFGLWDVDSESDPLFSVYAAHFLLEAREHSVEIPEKVFERAMEWLAALGGSTAYDSYTQFAQAYALYVRARNGERVTKATQALLAELDRQWQDKWRTTSIALMLAGTFKLLQMDDQAHALLKYPPQVWSAHFGWPLSDAGIYSSIYAWMSAKHFARETWLSPLDAVVGVSAMIEGRAFTSFSSSFALIGLDAAGSALSEGQRDFLKIAAREASAQAAPLQLFGDRILKAAVPLSTAELVYQGASNQVFFYGLSETGFDRLPPQQYSSGLTVERELRNEKGEKKSEFGLEEKLEVTLFIKSLDELRQMAILELIPGGFEIDLSEQGLASRKSLHEGANTWHPAFIDIQEDRLVFFGNLPKDTAVFSYRLKPLTRGRYGFAAAYAEGMYDPTKQFIGTHSVVEVK